MSPRTQVIVRVEADPGIASDARHLRVVVRAGPNRSTETLAVRSERDYPDVGPPVFPVEIGLVPADGDVGRVFEVTALAQDDGSPRATLATARVISGYVAGQTLLVTLRLEDSCRGITCGATQTCRSGDCFDAFVEPNVLHPYGADAGRPGVDARPMGMDAPALPDARRHEDDARRIDAPGDASDASDPMDAPETRDSGRWDVGLEDASVRDARLMDVSTDDGGPPRCAPGAAEICNSEDDDCDSLVDEGLSWRVISGSTGSVSVAVGGRAWALRRMAGQVALSYKSGRGIAEDVQFVQLFDAGGSPVGTPLSSMVGSPADIDAPGFVSGHWVVMGRQRSYACTGGICTYWYGSATTTASWAVVPTTAMSDSAVWSGFFAAHDRYWLGTGEGSTLTVRAFGAAGVTPLFTTDLYTASAGHSPILVTGVETSGAVQWVVAEESGGSRRTVLVRSDAEGAVTAGPYVIASAGPVGEPVALDDGLALVISPHLLHFVGLDGTVRSTFDLASDPDRSSTSSLGSHLIACGIDGRFERVGVRTDDTLQSLQSPTSLGYGAGTCAVVMLDAGAFFAISDSMGNTLRWGRIGCAG